MKTPTPQQINQWLEHTGRSRADLAKDLNVSAETVKGWLSSKRPITGAALQLLQILMKPTPVINPEFSLEEWNKIQALAEEKGISTREWINSVLKCEISTNAPLKPQAPTVKAGPNKIHIANDLVTDTSDQPPTALARLKPVMSQDKKEA